MQLELDFEPRLAHGHCDNCGELILLSESLVVTKKQSYHGPDLVFYFCDEKCGNEFYLERLRKEGL